MEHHSAVKARSEAYIYRPRADANGTHLPQLLAAGSKPQPSLAGSASAVSRPTPAPAPLLVLLLLPASTGAGGAAAATATPSARPDGPRPPRGVEDVAAEGWVPAACRGGERRGRPGGGIAAASDQRLAGGGGGWFELLRGTS